MAYIPEIPPILNKAANIAAVQQNLAELREYLIRSNRAIYDEIAHKGSGGGGSDDYVRREELNAYERREDLADVAESGEYADLTGKPALKPVATSGEYEDLTGTPELAAVATTGAYGDLTGKPVIPKGLLRQSKAISVHIDITSSTTPVKFSGSANIGVTGYTPIGVTALNFNDDSERFFVSTNKFYATGNGVAVIEGWIYPFGMAGSKNYTFTFDVLYIEN